MKKVCLNLSESRALGDTLCSTPTIRKLYNSYNQKISIITNHKEIFKNPLEKKLADKGVLSFFGKKIKHKNIKKIKN